MNIIVKEDNFHRFIFQNNYNQCGSHNQLADYYNNCGGDGYVVSGGFYSHTFETFSDDNLEIVVKFFGASSSFRKPTELEINDAILNWTHWRKEYIKFIVE